MKRTVITSLPQAFRVIKEMDLGTEQWDSDYRVAGRGAVAQIVEQQMRERVSRHLEEMARLAEADRRNGSFCRHLLTELGDIELHIPRTRRFSPLSVLRSYARRAPQVDQLILPPLCWGSPPARWPRLCCPSWASQSVPPRCLGWPEAWILRCKPFTDVR